MVIHRRSHAVLVRDWRGTASVRALALASCRKNACVSSDHLPPTSQAHELSPTKTPSQLGVCSLLPPSGHGESSSILPLATCPWQPVTSHWGHQCCVDCQLGSVEQRKSLSNHFKPATVLPPLKHQVQVADKNVGANPGSSLSAHSGCRRLQRVSPTTNTPASAQAARWWPRTSRRRRHRQLREEGGRGSQRRRRSKTRNWEESNLDKALVGKHAKGTPDIGPL